MNLLESALDVRHSMVAKGIAVLTAFVLVCSFGNIQAFGDPVDGGNGAAAIVDDSAQSTGGIETDGISSEMPAAGIASISMVLDGGIAVECDGGSFGSPVAVSHMGNGALFADGQASSPAIEASVDALPVVKITASQDHSLLRIKNVSVLFIEKPKPAEGGADSADAGNEDDVEGNGSSESEASGENAASGPGHQPGPGLVVQEPSDSGAQMQDPATEESAGLDAAGEQQGKPYTVGDPIATPEEGADKAETPIYEDDVPLAESVGGVASAPAVEIDNRSFDDLRAEVVSGEGQWSDPVSLAQETYELDLAAQFAAAGLDPSSDYDIVVVIDADTVGVVEVDSYDRLKEELGKANVEQVVKVVGDEGISLPSNTQAIAVKGVKYLDLNGKKIYTDGALASRYPANPTLLEAFVGLFSEKKAAVGKLNINSLITIDTDASLTVFSALTEPAKPRFVKSTEDGEAVPTDARALNNLAESAGEYPAKWDAETATLTYHRVDSAAKQDGTTAETLSKHTVTYGDAAEDSEDQAFPGAICVGVNNQIFYVKNGGRLTINAGEFSNDGGKRIVTVEDTRSDKSQAGPFVGVYGGLLSNNDPTDEGGVILGNGAEVEIAGTAVLEGKLDPSKNKGGGAIRLKNGSKLSIAGDAAIVNSTAKFGGAVYATENSEVTIGGNAVIAGCSSAGGHGGAVNINGGSLDVYGSAAILGSSTDSSGGAIATDNGTQVSIRDNAVIAGNSADVNGGAVFLRKTEMTVGDNVLFAANKAGSTSNIAQAVASKLTNLNGRGGAVYIKDGSSLTAGGHSVFAGNIAANDGGAVFAEIWAKSSVTTPATQNTGSSLDGTNPYNRIVLKDACLITCNQANNTPTCNSEYAAGGGGLFTYSDLVIENSGDTKNLVTVTGNRALDGGGGIGVAYGRDLKYHQPVFHMDNGIVAANWAGDNETPENDEAVRNNSRVGSEGGGIRFEGSGWIMRGYITNNRVNGNYDYGGGGLFVESFGNMRVYSPLVTDNEALGFGGGLAGCTNGILLTDEAGIYNNASCGLGITVNASERGDKWARYLGLNEEGTGADYYCAKRSSITDNLLGGGSYNWTGYMNAGGHSIGEMSLRNYNTAEVLANGRVRIDAKSGTYNNNDRNKWASVTINGETYSGVTAYGSNVLTIDPRGLAVGLEGTDGNYSSFLVAKAEDGSVSQVVLPSSETASQYYGKELKTLNLINDSNRDNHAFPGELAGTPPNGTKYPIYEIAHFPQGGMAYTTHFLALQANPSADDKDAAFAAATVFVNGNYSATHGGGIACNGRLTAGKTPPNTTPEDPDPQPEPTPETRSGCLELTKVFANVDEDSDPFDATVVFHVTGYKNKEAYNLARAEGSNPETEDDGKPIYDSYHGFHFGIAADGSQNVTPVPLEEDGGINGEDAADEGENGAESTAGAEQSAPAVAVTAQSYLIDNLTVGNYFVIEEVQYEGDNYEPVDGVPTRCVTIGSDPECGRVDTAVAYEVVNEDGTRQSYTADQVQNISEPGQEPVYKVITGTTDEGETLYGPTVGNIRYFYRVNVTYENRYSFSGLHTTGVVNRFDGAAYGEGNTLTFTQDDLYKKKYAKTLEGEGSGDGQDAIVVDPLSLRRSVVPDRAPAAGNLASDLIEIEL